MQRPLVQRIERALDQMKALNYTLPRVMQVVNSPKSAARDMVKVVGMDPVLTARVLRVANSPYFMVSEQVTSLHRATIQLGMNTVRNLALAATMREGFRLEGDVCLVTSEDFWKYTVGTAVLSDLLVRRARMPRKVQDEAFVVGLLHPIGIALLIQSFPEEFNGAVRVASEQFCPIEQIEDAQFQTNHRHIGLVMAKRWKLPEAVLDGIEFYCRPHLSTRPATHIVGVASAYVKSRQVGFSGDPVPHDIEENVWSSLRLTPEEVDDLIEERLDELLAAADEFIKGV